MIDIYLDQLTPAAYAFGQCYCGSGPVYHLDGLPIGELLNFGRLETGSVFDKHTAARTFYNPTMQYWHNTGVIENDHPYLWYGDYYGSQSSSPIYRVVDLEFVTMTGSINIGWDGPANYLNPGVPEPATWLMLILGFVAVALARKIGTAPRWPQSSQ